MRVVTPGAWTQIPISLWLASVPLFIYYKMTIDTMECLLGVHTLLGQSGNARLMATIHDDLNRFLLCYGNKMAFSVEERNIPMASLDCFYTRYLITYSNFSTSHQHLSINNLLLRNARRRRTELLLAPPSE